MDDERPPSLWCGHVEALPIGGVLIVLLSGGATATVALNTASGLAHEIFPKRQPDQARPRPRHARIQRRTADLPDPRLRPQGRLQGRLRPEDPPHSDTILLVRFDPEQGQTSVLSIPRDLMVNITTPHGQVYPSEKINAAYTIGSRARGREGRDRARRRNDQARSVPRTEAQRDHRRQLQGLHPASSTRSAAPT